MARIEINPSTFDFDLLKDAKTIEKLGYDNIVRLLDSNEFKEYSNKEIERIYGGKK